jgi:hypothetical protein
LAAGAWADASLDDFRISEVTLQTFIERRNDPVCPRFPEAPTTTGVVVAEIEVSAQGQLVSTAILEAPTLALAQCVRQALKGWTFRAIAGKKSARFRSKVTFYVQADGNGGMVVRSPAQVGYVGR